MNDGSPRLPASRLRMKSGGGLVSISPFVGVGWAQAGLMVWARWWWPALSSAEMVIGVVVLGARDRLNGDGDEVGGGKTVKMMV
ncbi:hypothetical protein Dimus_036041 [Dionaea muscipula]